MNSKNTKFVKRLIISYSLFLLVVLTMGVYLYTVSISNVSNEIRNQNMLALQKTVHDMDTAFTTMDILASQVVANSNVVRLATEGYKDENEFYLMAYHAKEDLSVYVFTESILPITEYNIYLQEPGYLLSRSQFIDTALYYNRKRSYDQDKYDEWLSLLGNPDMTRQFIPLDTFNEPISNTYLYLLNLDNYTFKNVPATICFEIDYSRLSAIFHDLALYETGHLIVTDANNNLIFTIDGPTSETTPVEDIINLSFKDGFSELNESQDEMFVTHDISPYNDWNYYLVQPANDSLYSLAHHRDIYFLVIALGLVVELIMIYFLSKTNVNKIRQLGDELQSSVLQQRSLQKLIDNQKPVIMYSYLDKILEGNIATAEELEYARQYLNITTESRKFTVLHLVAYLNQYELYVDDTVVTTPDHLDYKEIIQEAISQFFEMPTYTLINNEKEFSILISLPEEEERSLSKANVRTSFTNLHDYLNNNYSIYTFAGMGEWNTELSMTWKSYQQALESVTYATKRHIFKCIGNIERDSNQFYYPAELTRQLTNFITSGNTSQVLEIFEILRIENMEERSLPMHTMKYLLSDIRNTLYKIRFTFEETEDNESDLKTIDAMFNDHMSLKLYEDLASRLCNLVETKPVGNKLIAKIKTYIDDNYVDPSLCLNKISEEFGISESYFSYLFKEEMQVNFSSYLEQLRVQRAMDLLQTTDLNISEVYQEVGYNNSHTFRRAFKKTYGMSPKDARNGL